ncbi:MAG: hypothetical protein JWP12_1430 [Bacteroidetes bacterium]|nr:hypothetical protein [Bacteroidota bacterium]
MQNLINEFRTQSKHSYLFNLNDHSKSAFPSNKVLQTFMRSRVRHGMTAPNNDERDIGTQQIKKTGCSHNRFNPYSLIL